MHQVRLLNSVDEEDDILHVDASVSIHISRIIVVIDFPTGINSDEDDEVLCIDFAVVVKIAESNRLSGDLELNGSASRDRSKPWSRQQQPLQSTCLLR